MQSPESLQMVAQFHHTFNHPIEPVPVVPSEARCKLRVSLIAEELAELEAAIAKKDMVEIADALCDIQYVLSGAVLEFGLGNQFKALFEEVQRSNMSKACNTQQEAEETIEYYQKERGTPCHYKEVDGKFLVYRNEDNKTLKSIYYSPADLKSVLGAE